MLEQYALTVETYFVNIAASHDLILFSPSDSMAKLIVDMKSAYICADFCCCMFACLHRKQAPCCLTCTYILNLKVKCCNVEREQVTNELVLTLSDQWNHHMCSKYTSLFNTHSRVPCGPWTGLMIAGFPGRLQAEQETVQARSREMWDEDGKATLPHHWYVHIWHAQKGHQLDQLWLSIFPWLRKAALSNICFICKSCLI